MDKFIVDLSNPHFWLTAGFFAVLMNVLTVPVVWLLSRAKRTVPDLIRGAIARRKTVKADFIRDYMADAQLRELENHATTHLGLMALLAGGLGFGVIALGVAMLATDVVLLLTKLVLDTVREGLHVDTPPLDLQFASRAGTWIVSGLIGGGSLFAAVGGLFLNSFLDRAAWSNEANRLMLKARSEARVSGDDLRPPQ